MYFSSLYPGAVWIYVNDSGIISSCVIVLEMLKYDVVYFVLDDNVIHFNGKRYTENTTSFTTSFKPL
jgi:hypothetical protein